MDDKLKKKSMCEWGKEAIRSNMADMFEVVGNPSYICGKCARATRLKDTVCKPRKLMRPDGF